MAVGLILDAAKRGEGLETVAARLQRRLVQTEGQRRDEYRPTLRFLRGDRDAAQSAIDRFDEVIAAMGVDPAAMPLEDPTADEPLPAMDGTAGLLISFRDYLEASAGDVRERIADIKQKMEDPDTIALDRAFGFPTEVSLDLGRLADYESVAQYLSQHPRAWDLFTDSELTQIQDLYVAARLLTDFQNLPDDFTGMAEEVKPQLLTLGIDKQDLYQPLLQMLERERDALDRDIEIMDEYIELVAPPAPDPTPEPTEDP
jgi:hypothetical protein